MNELEFNVSRIIIETQSTQKNSIFLSHNIKSTITSVRIVNEIKIDPAKNIVYVI
jgi:hypothetical protein